MSNALYERYRPKAWSEVVGQDKVLSQIDRWRQNGKLTGRAIWITGSSGIGKTTISRLLVDEVADPWGFIELDSREVTPHRVEELARSFQVAGQTKPGRVVIINEPDGLRDESASVLLTKLEQIPSHGLWIFTATPDSEERFLQDCPSGRSLLTRCVALRLAQRGIAEPFARRAAEIAIQEELAPAGITVTDCERLIANMMRRHGTNFRSILSKIDGGALLD